MLVHRSRWYGAERPKWLGPLPFAYPEHLTGDAPGDYGFDPCVTVCAKAPWTASRTGGGLLRMPPA